MTAFQRQNQPTRAQQNSSAALGSALALVNPYLGALYGVTNFLFGQGGFSPRALNADVGSLTISELNRELKLPAVTPPPVTTGRGYGAVWDSTRAFYAAQNFPARAGLPDTPPPEFVAAWRKYSSTKNPGEEIVGWQRFAELSANLQAKGYQPPEWGMLFASTASDTRKTGDYLGVAAAAAPAVLDFLKPAAAVKPIPTGGPNPGVPQMAFVGAIPEIVVVGSRAAAPLAARAAPLLRAGLAALGLTIGGATVSKGPVARYKRLQPAPQPVVPKVAPKPATPLPTQMQPQLAAPPQVVPEITVTTTPVRPIAIPPVSLSSVTGTLTQLLSPLAKTMAGQLVSTPVKAAVSTPVSAKSVTAIASALAPFYPLLSPALQVAAPQLGRIRAPVPVVPGLNPAVPMELQPATQAATATERCTCTTVDNSPAAKKKREEQRKKRKARRCFSSSQALSAYVRKRITRRK